MIDSKIANLLAILACPHCGSSLNYKEEGNELLCLQSKLAFPIIDDIPIMLLDKARNISAEELSSLMKNQQ